MEREKNPLGDIMGKHLVQCTAAAQLLRPAASFYSQACWDSNTIPSFHTVHLLGLGTVEKVNSGTLVLHVE